MREDDAGAVPATFLRRRVPDRDESLLRVGVPRSGRVRVSPRGDRLAVSGARLRRRETPCSSIDRSGPRTTLSKGWASHLAAPPGPPDGDEVWFTALAAAGTTRARHALWAVTLVRPRAAGRPRAHPLFGCNDIFRDGRVLLSVSDTAGPACSASRRARRRSASSAGSATRGSRTSRPTGSTLLFAAGQPGDPRGQHSRPSTSATPTARPRCGWETVIPCGSHRTGDGCSPGRRTPGGGFSSRPAPACRASSRPVPSAELTDGGLAGRSAASSCGAARMSRAIGGSCYVQDVETGALTPVTPEGVYPVRAWTGDPGSERPCCPRRSGPVTPGCSIPVDGGDPRPDRAPRLRRTSRVQWSADGRVAVRPPSRRSDARGRRDRPSRGHRDREGARPSRRCLRPTRRASEWIERVAITPDGQSYCYTYSQMLATLYVAEGLR